MFINEEYRATVGGVYQERLDRDRTDLPTDALEPTDRVDIDSDDETDVLTDAISVDSVQ